MERRSVVNVVAILCGGAYGAWGLFTEAGLVGWLNAQQQRLFGAYRPLFSFLAVLTLAAGAGALLSELSKRLFRPAAASPGAVDLSRPPGTPAQALAPPAPPAPRSQGRTLLRAALVLLPVTWLAGWGAHAWLVRQAREDAGATYQELVLTEGTPVPALTGTHLALHGIPVTEVVVEHRSGNSVGSGPDQQYIPLVGVNWRPDRAVRFVVKVGQSEVLPGPAYPPDPRARNPREVVVFARTAGALPGPVRAEFDRMRVPLESGATLLHLVPTLDGRPVGDDTEGPLYMIVGLCGIVSVFLLVLPVIGYREDRRRR